MLLAKRWLNAWIYFVCIWELAAGSRPQFDTSTNMGLVLVPADAEVDSVIFRLRATDQDADFPLVFDITAAVQPIVRIENLPCTLYNKVCQANVILTRRLVPGRLHDFAVRVKDSKGDSNSMQATISVTNASTPRDMIFPHVPSIIMVPEDTKPGKELDYLLVRANPWQGKPVYIELWQPKELFTIRQRQTPTQTRGVITLIGELDFETQSMYTLTMYATDPYTEPGKDTRNIAGVHVVVIVQDVQDVPPVFTIAPPLTRVNNSVKPGDVILRVHAEDGDKGTPREVTYGLVSDGNPLTPFFNISEWTGEITLARPLDELTQITHVGAPILLTVVAEEVRRLRDEPPAQATVVELGLLLGEPGNSPPYFESDSYMAWMDENATPGTIVMFDKPYLTTVRDEDIGKTGVFALKLGNNNGTFEVTPTVAERVANFVVTVRDNALMDFEARKTVEFTIIAQEVGPATNLSTSVPVTVFLKDINDNPPEFEKDVYEVTLIENVSPKTRVVQVHATDKDTGLSGSVRYTGIIGPGNETLTMDSETGLIVVADGSPGLDREVTASLRLFVEARDENGRGLSSTVPLIVNLLDVNDNAPIFDKPIYEFILNSEQTNFTSPAFIRAVDADAEPPNNEVRYELMHGNYGNKFRLNEVTGELTLREPLTKSRRRRNNDYVTFATKFKSNLLQTLNMYQKIGSSTEKPLRIWKNRKKRAAEDVVYTLTVRAYDLGVPHLSSTAKVYIINATPMGALTLMLVVPAKDLDPLHTTEILAAITGGRVTIQDIRPYDQPGQPKNATSQGEKMSIVVARVEPTMSGTFLVDIEKIHKSLVANGMNIVPVTDSKTDSSKVENTPPDVGSSVTNPIGNSVVNPVGSISGRNNGSNSGRVQGNAASTGSGRGGENTIGGMGGGSSGSGKGGENTVGGMGGGSTGSGKGVENTGVGLSGGSTDSGKGFENTVVGLSGSNTSNGKGGENNIGGIGGGSTGSGNRGGNTMDGIGGSSAGNTGEGTIVKTSLGTYESSGGKSNIDTVNKTTLASNNEYIVYKAENKLLLWLLILLGLMMLLALLGLILCCICPGCPFYMAPRKRRVHSLETVNYVEGRPKRHLRRKQENVAKAEWSEKKQAWSADPMRHTWQFNRRNTKNRGIASLPGDVAEVRTLQGASKAPSFRMKDGPPSWRVQDMTQKRQDERLYVEDVETGQTYDIGDVDSLRRHEMERGSDVLRRSYHPADESLQFPREQQFYRNGNAEVLRLITRGHEKDDDVSPQAQRPITLVLDQQALGYRTDGKDILLRRFMEDQRIRQQQDIHGSVQEISVDALEPGKQGSGQFLQKHEVLLVPSSLEPDRRQQRGEKSPSVQCLIIDHGDLEDEEELKVRKQQIESKEAELQQQRKVAAAMLVGTAVAKATENAEQHGSFLNIPSYASQHAELAKQNALLTQLVMDRDARTLRVSGIDPGNYLETQSLPGQVAIATQTDRTAATQTDHFTQVRSRSDNDESDDEVRSRRKSKSKKRFGSELRRSRSLLMRSPIQEEARSSSDTRTNLLRRKAKDTREGRRATLEPEVLREISDSLDEHASTPSLEERRVENTESREMKNVDYKSDERADLNGEELSEIPRQSSPDAGKNKYHKRSHANAAVEDTSDTHKLESKTKKQPSPTKSKVNLPKTEIKSVSSKKSDKKESDTTSSTKSISKRKSTESQSSSSGTEKNKKVKEDKKKSQSKSGPKPVMLKTTSEKPNKKSKPREPEEVPIAKKRTLLRQLKAKKMSTESSEVEELPDRSRHSSLKTKKSKHDPTKAKGINVLSDEPKSRSSETDRSQLLPRHQQSDSYSSTETTEQHDITAGEKKTSISSKVKEIKQDGQKNKIVQDSQTQKTQSETQPRQEVRKDPGSPEISKKLTTDAVQTMEMVSDPHQITGKENSNKPNGLNSKLDSDAGKLSTVSKEGQRKPTTYDDVGKVGVGSQSESGKLSPTLNFETLKSDANGKIETEPAEPSADEGSKTIDKISDKSKEPEVKVSESKVNTVIEKQLEPGSEKLSESDDKISRYLGEAVPIIVANNSKVDKISSPTEKGLKPSTTGTQGITEETSVEPETGRPDLSESAVNVAPVEKQPDSTIKDSPMADEDSQKITADALPKSASQTVETDIDTFSKEKPKSIPKEMIKMFLESEAVHSARDLLQSFVKTESHPVPSSEKSLKPDINDALVVELSQEARTHQDTPGDENSAEKIKGDGEIGPIEASTSSADQIREKNDDAKSNLVDSTTLAVATTSDQINKIEDANKTIGGNPEKAPNETSLLNNASISPPDVARSETKRSDITRSEVDPPQMEQKSESPKRDKNELEKLESTDITNESSIAGPVGNIESSKTDKSLLPTDNSNDKSENEMIAATKKEKEIEVDQHSFPTVSDTKDNDMKSPEQNLAQVSNASDIPERESPSFYVLSGTSSPEGLDSKQEIRDKEIASDESSPEKTAAVPASSISELLTATEKREKVNIEPSKMQGQPLNSAKIQSQEWYKQLQTGDTSSDFSEVTQPYQTPRHRSKNRDGNGEEPASVGIPAITAQLLDEGNDIPQAEHVTRSTDKRPDSKKNDSKIQMRDETPGAFAPDNRDDELTPRLIAEEAIRSGLEELIATSGAPKMEKQSSKQPSSKASPENERVETSKRKSTKDTGRTPSSVESKKSVKERTGNGSQPIKKNAESQETTKLRRPKTEPKGGSQLEEDKHLQVRPRTQRGKPSDPRQEPTIQRSKPQERGGGDQARRNAEEAKSEESDQSKPAETKTGYMSRYKQKREEMERRRKELKEAAEEEQRPRWQRKPQRAPGKEAPRIKDMPQEVKTPEGATPRTRRRIKPLVNAESEQLRAMVKEGRKLRKAEGGDSDDPPVEIFASEPPRRTSPSHRPSHQQSSYNYEKVQPPFYLHPPPPVPHPSPQVSPLHGSQDSKRPDDDLDSGIAVSLQGGTKLRHQQLLEKKSVFDIAYSEAAPSQLRTDSTTPPS
ncbi:cadherin-86C [Diprion similis]|uniref:cadherin-86C n=1 Tax=Diprion similis TaxID=362088 RepID=UPI001EF9077C|nr:cadherin-86C [Diprion similis]